MKKVFLTLSVLVSALAFSQSYPPQAGEDGSTAIHKDSPLFVAWATGCEVVRGPMQIDNPSLGNASVGTPANAIGKDNGLVSLGDGGTAILTFEKPIKNGEGADFAIFENGFIDGRTDLAFLELAFVEVSSDGINYFRFPAVNEYPSDFVENSVHGSGFASMDARYLHNFAGKYIGGYGTPFDLDEIPDNDLLDKNAITHVKIIDVIGTNKEPYRTYDSKGNIAIDPFPTPFPSSGFDLSGVGVIHQNNNLATADVFTKETLIYPNPFKDFISIKNHENIASISIIDIAGRLVKQVNKPTEKLLLPELKSGLYILKIQHKNGKTTSEKVLKK
ncbi:MAG: T9SS type A sorting domain-containing protein [Cruoricaptor ignavus]|nr:T9SS type A sorting domain-containing protein [Cruoricaptor ignavus]